MSLPNKTPQKQKFQPIGFLLKFDPPIISLLYHPIVGNKPNVNKKKMYVIHLNQLIFLAKVELIVERLLQEHVHFLNPDIVKEKQVII